MSDVQVTLNSFKQACPACQVPFWWVLWMRAISSEPPEWHDLFDEDDPAGGCFDMPVALENPTAVNLARSLFKKLGEFGRMKQLVDRGFGAVGASYNANRCPRCHDVADWDVFDGLILDAAYEQRKVWRAGPCAVSLLDWENAVAAQHNVRGF